MSYVNVYAGENINLYKTSCTGLDHIKWKSLEEFCQTVNLNRTVTSNFHTSPSLVIVDQTTLDKINQHKPKDHSLSQVGEDLILSCSKIKAQPEYLPAYPFFLIGISQDALFNQKNKTTIKLFNYLPTAIFVADEFELFITDWQKIVLCRLALDSDFVAPRFLYRLAYWAQQIKGLSHPTSLENLSNFNALYPWVYPEYFFTSLNIDPQKFINLNCHKSILRVNPERDMSDIDLTYISTIYNTCFKTSFTWPKLSLEEFKNVPNYFPIPLAVIFSNVLALIEAAKTDSGYPSLNLQLEKTKLKFIVTSKTKFPNVNNWQGDLAKYYSLFKLRLADTYLETLGKHLGLESLEFSKTNKNLSCDASVSGNQIIIIVHN